MKLLKTISNIKVSIRISILSLFMILLLTVGITIGVLNYDITQNILLQSAAKVFSNSSTIVEQYVKNLFAPGKQRINIGSALIRNNIVKVENSEHFNKFMLQMLFDLPNYPVVAWSDPNGNYYEIERETKNHFFNIVISCRKNICYASRKHIDETMRSLGPIETASWIQSSQQLLTGSIHPYDPRNRPWYKDAIQNRNPGLSDIFLSIPFKERPRLAVSYVHPVYKSNELLGVFYLKIYLRTITDFVANLKITKNSHTYLFDSKNELITADSSQNSSATITNLQASWLQSALQQPKPTKNAILSFKYNNKTYWAFYDRLQDISANNWSFGIVIPATDITGKLAQQLYLAMVITVIVLLFGSLLVWLISNAISRPIIRLADATRKIKTLEPPLLDKIHSHIKEIIYMQDAFITMEQSLKSFTRYVPHTLVKNLISSGDIAHVGGETKRLTFLFSDITGFTSIAENISAPKLLGLLSEYFETMTKIIHEQKGTVDKYIGDGIMAFWGAPLEDHRHAIHACKAALTMQAAVSKLNQHWQATTQQQLYLRIGINTGRAIVGNVGSADRLSYTAIGDSVNLANRIEQLNKFYTTSIIISHTTYQLVKDEFCLRLIDNIAVRGKKDATYLYELLPKQHPLTVNITTFNSLFLEAFTNYQNQHWDKALELFQEIDKLFRDDHIVTMYILRCKYLLKHKPQNWDSTWRFNDELSKKNFTLE